MDELSTPQEVWRARLSAAFAAYDQARLSLSQLCAQAWHELGEDDFIGIVSDLTDERTAANIVRGLSKLPADMLDAATRGEVTLWQALEVYVKAPGGTPIFSENEAAQVMLQWSAGNLSRDAVRALKEERRELLAAPPAPGKTPRVLDSGDVLTIGTTRVQVVTENGTPYLRVANHYDEGGLSRLAWLPLSCWRTTLREWIDARV